MGDVSGREVVFAGDLDDPWVAAIAAALPAMTRRLPLAGDLPEHWPDECASARCLILHRPTPSATDLVRFRRVRRIGGFPRLVLCVGPHARYAQVQPWTELAEAILPEATAADTIGRHLDPPPEVVGAGGPVVVVSAQHELGRWLVEACDGAGYDARRVSHWRDAPRDGPAIWDVPVLEPGWPEALAEQARRRPVVALLGLADRAIVGLARSRGAAACLDLPCDPADLAFVLSRLDVSHSAPLPAGSLRRDAPRHPAPIRARIACAGRSGRPTMIRDD